MKPYLAIIVTALLFTVACNTKNKPSKIESSTVLSDSIQVIIQNYKNTKSVIEYEIPVFKETKMRHGLQKRFYFHGSLYSTIPYTYGKREGTALTYYPESAGSTPMVWKEQPYKNNKLEGTCRRYHRNGNLQAEYEYKNGLPAIGTEEFSKSGKPIDLPSLILTKSKLTDGHYINARLSNNSNDVDYYIGSLIEGKYLPNNLKGLQVKQGLGEIVIYNTNTEITITAVYTSKFRNKCLISKTIQL